MTYTLLFLCVWDWSRILTWISVWNNNQQESSSQNHGGILQPDDSGQVSVSEVDGVSVGRRWKPSFIYPPGLISEPCHYQSSGLFWSTGSLMQGQLHFTAPPCCQQRCPMTSNKTHSSLHHGKGRGCVAEWMYTFKN